MLFDSNARKHAQVVLEYYRAVTEATGLDPKHKDDDSTEKKQANYSIRWFYDNLCQPGSFETLTPQLQAVLIGECEERKRLFDSCRHEKIEVDKSSLLESEGGKHSLYKNQVLAIERCLNEPVSLVQGPPGTGKTLTILNMVS